MTVSKVPNPSYNSSPMRYKKNLFYKGDGRGAWVELSFIKERKKKS
jgi:hypothetical protein